MQPLGAPGTPASPQALPYNYFPAPRIGPASAGAPAAPIAPAIQNTQAQIGDALAAAQGPQQAPLRPQHLGEGGGSLPQGALGMAAAAPGHTQQPSPWGGMFGGQQPQQGPQMPGFGGMMAPGDGAAGFGGFGGFGMLPPQLRELFGAQQQPRFWGGFNWGGRQQQPQSPGQSPMPNSPRRPGFDFGVLQQYQQGGPFG